MKGELLRPTPSSELLESLGNTDPKDFISRSWQIISKLPPNSVIYLDLDGVSVFPDIESDEKTGESICYINQSLPSLYQKITTERPDLKLGIMSINEHQDVIAFVTTATSLGVKIEGPICGYEEIDPISDQDASEQRSKLSILFDQELLVAFEEFSQKIDPKDLKKLWYILKNNPNPKECFLIDDGNVGKAVEILGIGQYFRFTN